MNRLSQRSTVALVALVAAALGWWALRSSRDAAADGREPIVFYAGWLVGGAKGDDIYGAINRFEKLHPEYRVTMTTSAAQDETGDAQRLLLAITGGVPPDVVFFDRFAIGEWAAKNALEDLTPYVEKQDPTDPDRIDLGEYYPWAVEEASYRPPGSLEPRRLYGIPSVVDVRMLYSNVDLLRQEGLVDEKGDP